MFVTIYFMCMIAQVIIPSYYGSLLIDESKKMTNTIFNSQWMDRDEKCKKAYLIFVQRTLHPMTLFAGGVFLLSLPTFLQVIYKKYSQLMRIFLFSLYNAFTIFVRYAKQPIRCLHFSNVWTNQSFNYILSISMTGGAQG